MRESPGLNLGGQEEVMDGAPVFSSVLEMQGEGGGQFLSVGRIKGFQLLCDTPVQSRATNGRQAPIEKRTIERMSEFVVRRHRSIRQFLNPHRADEAPTPGQYLAQLLDAIRLAADTVGDCPSREALTEDTCAFQCLLFLGIQLIELDFQHLL